MSSLLTAFSFLNREQASTLLVYVPRYVAVVGNMPDPEWTTALRALDVQYLTVSVYRDRNGESAHEVEGQLITRTESLGFARFSAIDNCLRINKGCGLPSGTLQIIDQFGNPTLWTVHEALGICGYRRTGVLHCLNMRVTCRSSAPSTVAYLCGHP